MVLAFMAKGKEKALKIIIFWAFIFIFIFSETGADFESYRQIYTAVQSGRPLNDIHGEIAFLFIMRIFSNFGFSYYAFRVIFVTIALFILFYFANKITPSPLFTFLILMLGYILYMTTIYRQLMTMAMLFGLFYYVLYKKNYIKAMICAILAILFHISGVIGLAFIFLHLFFKLFNIRSDAASKKYFNGLSMFILLTLAFCFRIFIYFYGSRFFYSFVGFYPETVLFSVGVLSRLVLLCLVAWQIKQGNFSEKINILYCFYFLSLFVYFAFPFELIMGRLTNNARILDIIFIPLIIVEAIKNNKVTANTRKKHKRILLKPNYNKTRAIVASIAIFGIYWSMYIYQMLMQGGYYPFVHFIFG